MFYRLLNSCFPLIADHDKGILTLDHISFEEMESEIVRQIEQPGHKSRMAIAYSRSVQPRVA